MNDLAFCITQNKCGLLTFSFLNTAIFTGTIKNSVGNEILLFDQTITTFQLPEDGIYFINLIVQVTTPTPGQTYYNFVEYSFCNVSECVKKLLKDIFCKEDPCCTNCDSAKSRHNLNKIMAAFFTFNSLIDAFRLKYSVSYCATPETNESIVEILEWHKLLLKLTKSCGDCIKPISETKPCKTC